MYAEDFNTPAATTQPAKRRRTDGDEAVSDEDLNSAGLLVALSESGGGPSSPAAGEVQKHTESPPSTAVDFKKQAECYSPSTDHPPPGQKNYYRCGVCGKAFSSYQALGGHKSSHRDKPAAAGSHKRKTAIVGDYCPDPNTGGTLHECAICGKNFPTGQSLGGHKRKHYQGAKIGGNTSEIDGGGSSGVTSSWGGGASSQYYYNGDAAPVRWNFDLNLPPPIVDLELRL